MASSYRDAFRSHGLHLIPLHILKMLGNPWQYVVIIAAAIFKRINDKRIAGFQTQQVVQSPEQAGHKP